MKLLQIVKNLIERLFHNCSGKIKYEYRFIHIVKGGYHLNYREGSDKSVWYIKKDDRYGKWTKTSIDEISDFIRYHVQYKNSKYYDVLSKNEKIFYEWYLWKSSIITWDEYLKSSQNKTGSFN